MIEQLIENAALLQESTSAIPPKAGAALGLGLASIGAGYAERGIGSAAIGAMAEDNLGFGIALVMTVLPETLAILAFVLVFLV